jgi:hypothetical protein
MNIWFTVTKSWGFSLNDKVGHGTPLLFGHYFVLTTVPKYFPSAGLICTSKTRLAAYHRGLQFLMRHLQSPWTPVSKKATAHISVLSLENILDDAVICRGLWLPGSPHLHLSDFCGRHMLRSKVCSNIPRTEHDLETGSQDLASLFLPAGILCIVNNVHVRCDPCLQEEGKYFRYFH